MVSRHARRIESPQSLFWPCVATEILCRDRIWRWAKVFWVAIRAFLCRDKSSPWVGFPCCNIAFYVTTVGHDDVSQTGLGACTSDGAACVTEPTARTTGVMWTLSQQTCPISKKKKRKKKRNLGNWGVTCWYQSIGIRIPWA